MDLNLAFAGLQNASDDLEHRRLAGTVSTNKANDLAAMHIKRNVLKCTEFLKEQLVLCELNKVLFEVCKRLGRHIKDHGDVFNLDSKRLLAVINSRFSHEQHSLDVENELVLGLVEHGIANGKGKNSPGST